MKGIFLLIGIAAAFTLAAQENVSYVAAKTGLNIREKPASSAKVLGKIPYATKVSLQEASTENRRVETEGFIGYWKKVNYDNITGYIIDAYLLPYPPPGVKSKTTRDYLSQISVSFGDSLVVDNKMEGDGEGGFRLTKQLYKNGAEWHEFLGYEYNSMTYFIPGLTMQQAFLLIRLLPEFTEYVGEKEEFITANKKIKKKDREYEYRVEKEIFGDTPWIEKIKIGFEEGAIYNFEMYQIDNQIVIFYGAGV